MAAHADELEARVEERTAALHASLREKEVMLQEIHHRVRNNLQVIISLLNLQSRKLDDPQAQEAFRESKDRIYSMALVHESLYQSADLANIPIVEHLSEVIRYLSRSYGAEMQMSTIKVEGDDIQVDINAAIPLGLIVTELVTNALKYAFPDGRKGEICVEICSEGENIHLEVRNDGVELPADMDIHALTSLGLQLVSGLTQQLGGTLEVRRSPQTAFRITFPKSGVSREQVK